MTNWRKLSLGLAAATLLFIVATPRVARGLASALVQVTNTATGPAVTQDVSKLAGQIITLVTPNVFGASSGLTTGFDFFQVPAGGCEVISTTSTRHSNCSTAYIVPANQSLVISAVELSNEAGVSIAVSLVRVDTSNTSYIFDSWKLPSASPTVEFSYPAGLVIGSGTVLEIQAVNGNGQNVPIQATLHGYLTAN